MLALPVPASDSEKESLDPAAATQGQNTVAASSVLHSVADAAEERCSSAAPFSEFAEQMLSSGLEQMLSEPEWQGT